MAVQGAREPDGRACREAHAGKGLWILTGVIGVVLAAGWWSRPTAEPALAPELMPALRQSFCRLHLILTRSIDDGYRGVQIALKNTAATQRAMMTALIALQQQLLAHDLTVTGLNPSAGVDFKERDSRAYQKYVELQKQFDQIRQEVQRLDS